MKNHIKDFGRFSVNEAEQQAMDFDAPGKPAFNRPGAPTFAYVICTTRTGKEVMLDAFLDPKMAGEELHLTIEVGYKESKNNKGSFSKQLSHVYMKAMFLEDLAEIIGEKKLDELLRDGDVYVKSVSDILPR